MVNSRHVDWSEEFDKDIWELTCPSCQGRGYFISKEVCEPCDDVDCDQCEQSEDTPYCEYCEESGIVQPYWNTAWDTEIRNISEDQIQDIHENCNVLVIFNNETNTYWLTLSGCGMDLTPDMCWAWVKCGFSWLPMEWATSINPTYKAYLSQEQFDEVLEAAKYTFQLEIDRCKHGLTRLGVKGEI